MADRVKEIRKQILCLQKKKVKFEERQGQLLEALNSMNAKIDKVEEQIERVIQELIAKGCEERCLCQINRMKKEQENTEILRCLYDEYLRNKVEQYKKCAKRSH